MRHFLAALTLCRKGATAVEYGFILALVVLAMLAALNNLAGVTVGMWTNIAAKVGSVI